MDKSKPPIGDLESLHIVVCKKPLDHVEGPARGEPWVFVEEETYLFPLVLIHLSAEPVLSLRLFQPELELLNPDLIVAVHVFVQLLEPREHRTRR